MTTPLNNHFGCRVGRQYPSSERQYTAAKSNRLTGDWIPINQDVNTLIRTSSAQIRARSRQLVRDFPFFARAVSVLTNFTVGSGIQFQSQVRKADNSFDKKICDQIEDAVKWGMDELDAGGRMHGHELERLCKRQDVEAGECLLVKVMLKDPNRYTPLAYIPYEPDWLSSVPEIVGAGNQFRGIEKTCDFKPACDGKPYFAEAFDHNPVLFLSGTCFFSQEKHIFDQRVLQT